MLVALFIGCVPAALGVAALGLERSTRVLGPARSLALGAALSVVLAELIPSAVEARGLSALLLVVATLALPFGLDRLTARVLRVPIRGRWELGFAALGVHQLVDGLQLGAGSTLLGPGVLVGIAAHGTPLVAAAVLAAQRTEGTRRAAWRGMLLVGATATGVLLGGLVPSSVLAPTEPWLRAGIAGLLLHVVTHDLLEDLPTRSVDRVLDTLAFAAGVLLPLLTLHPDDLEPHEGAHGHGALLAELARLLHATSVPLLVGLGLAALLRVRATPQRRHLADTGLVEGTGLAVWLLGPPALVALLPAWVQATQRDPVPHPSAHTGPPLARQAARTLPWALLGLLVAAYIVALSPPAHQPMPVPLQVALAVALCGSARWPAALLPLPAAALLGAGAAPVAVFIGLSLGPLQAAGPSPRRWVTAMAAGSLGLLASFQPLTTAPLTPGPPLAGSTWGLVSTVIVVVWTTVSVVTRGVRPWLAPLLGGHAHGGSHDMPGPPGGARPAHGA